MVFQIDNIWLFFISTHTTQLTNAMDRAWNHIVFDVAKHKIYCYIFIICFTIQYNMPNLINLQEMICWDFKKFIISNIKTILLSWCAFMFQNHKRAIGLSLTLAEYPCNYIHDHWHIKISKHIILDIFWEHHQFRFIVVDKCLPSIWKLAYNIIVPYF